MYRSRPSFVPAIPVVLPARGDTIRSAQSRKPYSAPVLIRYGTIAELTGTSHPKGRTDKVTHKRKTGYS